MNLTRRQQLALDTPVEWDGTVGFVSREPKLREIEVHVAPGEQKLPIGTPGRLRAKALHWQMSTILTVDLETPLPLWHARIAWMDVGADRPRPLATWAEWQIERAMKRLVSLLPNWRPDFTEKAQLDKQKYSLHMRLPVTEVEKSYIIARGAGAVLPLVGALH